MLEVDIIAYLKGCNGITLLINDRIHPLRLPQTPTVPAMVYQKISQAPGYSQQGNSGMDSIRLQFTFWSETLLEAQQLANELQEATEGRKNMNGREAVSFVENRQSGDDPDTGLFRETLDLVSWHGG
jgi:hypothetical protein